MKPAERTFTAKRFLGMLEVATDAGKHCPFAENFEIGLESNRVKCDYGPFEQCDMCAKAVGLDPEEANCPCYSLGCREAVKRAWLFIEDSGILDSQEPL